MLRFKSSTDTTIERCPQQKSLDGSRSYRGDRNFLDGSRSYQDCDKKNTQDSIDSLVVEKCPAAIKIA